MKTLRCLVALSMLAGGSALLAANGLEPADYVESDGTTYFQTTIEGYPTLTVEARVWLPPTAAYCALCGSEASADDWLSPMGFTRNGTSTTEVCATIRSYGLPVSVATVPVYTWVTLRGSVTSTGRKFYRDGELVYEDDKGSAITSSNAKDIRLFAGINRYGTMQNLCVAGTRVASLKIWRSEDTTTDPIASYAPVSDPQTGATYLYDSVTKTYLRPFNDKKPTKVYVALDGSDSNPGFTPTLPFRTIAKGLAESGSDIILAAGTYSMTAGLTVSSGQHLRGATGRARDVVLDGGGSDVTAITFAKNPTKQISVESLTVSNYYKSAGSTLADAVGIVAARSAYWGGEEDPTARNVISNCIITCCGVGESSLYRHAVSLDFYSRLIDSVVISNAAVGVRLDSGGEVLGSVCSSNDAGIAGYWYGATVDAHNGTGHMRVRNCLVEGNRNTPIQDVTQVLDSRIVNNVGNPCGIRLQTVLGSSVKGSSFAISNCVFSGNRGATDMSQGTVVVSCKDLTVNDVLIDSCVISSNSVAYYPGLKVEGNAATTLAPGAIRVRNTLIANNCATASVSGVCATGVYVLGINPAVDQTPKIVFENCTVAGNQTVRNVAGAVCFVNATAAITNCVFANNQLKATGEDRFGHGVTSSDGNWNAEGRFGYNYLYPAESVKTFADAQHVVNGTATPRFMKGTYVPRTSSPLHAAGLVLPWMADAHDLQRRDDGTFVGAPSRTRLLDGAVDIGAYQSGYGLGFLLMFR